MAAPKRQNIRQNITFRFRIFFIIMLAAFLLLVLNLYKVVFIQGHELREEASSIYIKERMVDATRGNIYSDDGSLLATSLPKYRLGMDPSVYNKSTKAEKLFTAHVRELAEHLANFFKDRTADEYYDKIVSAKKRKLTYILLNNRLLDFQERKLVMNFPLFRENKKSPVKTGIVFDKVNVRYAPFGQMAYRTVGYMKDKVKVGLEGAFDEELRGIPGKGYFAKMDKNTWRPVENTPEIIPQRGVDLQTTIDVDIQDIVELALMKALAGFKGSYATAIVMETATGEIKAISNLTRNEKSPTGYSEFDNYAIEVSGNDPGSVFKLPSMMAMMEESNMPLTDQVTTGGKYTIFGKTMSDSHDYGTLTVQAVVEKSSNIGTIKLMQRVFSKKQAKFYDYLQKFHLIEPLDFQIKPRDPRPKFPLPPTWHALQYMWSSVGYSSNTSPLHLLSFYNAIANNGYWIQPIIVKKATIGNEVITDFTLKQKKDKETICSAETLKKIKIMLEGVVERGTGNNLKGTPYGIAGKTGTAQSLVNGQYIKGAQGGTYYVSFIGYFPVKKPKYTVLVAMDKPKGGSEGTYARQVTAPVFKDISDHIYSRDMKLQGRLSGYLPDSLNNAKMSHLIHPMDHGVLYANLGFPKVEEDGRWMQFSLDKKAVQNVPVSLLPKVVPNVMGMNLRDALFALENRGFKVRAKGIGNVVSQSIPAGTPLRKNALMLIQLH
jgi:cell division protein FtsI (penicillin-binding protein 3)